MNTNSLIRIPPEFPEILKNYSKAVLRDQPTDILAFSVDIGASLTAELYMFLELHYLAIYTAQILNTGDRIVGTQATANIMSRWSETNGSGSSSNQLIPVQISDTFCSRTSFCLKSRGFCCHVDIAGIIWLEWLANDEQVIRQLTPSKRHSAFSWKPSYFADLVHLRKDLGTGATQSAASTPEGHSGGREEELASSPFHESNVGKDDNEKTIEPGGQNSKKSSTADPHPEDSTVLAPKYSDAGLSQSSLDDLVRKSLTDLRIYSDSPEIPESSDKLKSEHLDDAQSTDVPLLKTDHKDGKPIDIHGLRALQTELGYKGNSEASYGKLRQKWLALGYSNSQFNAVIGGGHFMSGEISWNKFLAISVLTFTKNMWRGLLAVCDVTGGLFYNDFQDLSRYLLHFDFKVHDETVEIILMDINGRCEAAGEVVTQEILLEALTQELGKPKERA